MAGVDAFVPIDRRHAIAAGRALPDRTEGAALFADVSGFTSLTERLGSELGARRGADALLGHIDGVYAGITDAVHRFGGSVVSFAGDALVAWFDESHAAPGEVSARAVAGAVAMQSAMDELPAVETSSAEAIRMRLKVGIAAGPTRRFLVGDPAVRVLDVLAGRTIDRVAAAQAQARSGDIIVDAAVRDRLGRDLRLRSRRDLDSAFGSMRALRVDVPSLPWAEPPPLHPDEARRWLSSPVLAQLEAGGRFAGDLRSSVPLFVAFSGIDYDADPDAGETLDAWVRWAERVLDGYGGTLVSVGTGDKGSHLFGVFGALVAHDDDAARAIAAALDLVAGTPELGTIRDVRVGVALGSVWAGACGGPDRRSHNVLGGPVNLAARLMSIAQPGQILISEPVARDTADRFATADLGATIVKGSATPERLMAVTGRRLARTPAAPAAGRALVGRARELQSLEEALQDAAGGTCRLALVEAEAGMGKSHLAQELAARARSLGLAVHYVAGDPTDSRRAYHAWRDALAALLGSGTDGPAAALARLRALVPDLAERAALLQPILDLDADEGEATRHLAGEARAEATRDLIVRLLAAASAGPFLLVIEDAHWLDSASWALLHRLRRASPPALLAVFTRSAPTDRGDADADDRDVLRTAPGVLPLRLGPLEQEDMIAIARARLGVTALPAALEALIGERASGNPYFAEELVFAVRDAGLLDIQGDRCVLRGGEAALRDFGAPDSVERVIRGRLDRIGAEPLLVAKVASVLGSTFTQAELAAVMPVEAAASHLPDQLDALRRLDITPQVTADPEPVYRFRHAILRDVVYESMLTAQRRTLHGAAAHWFERTRAAEPAAASLIAHHWEHAGSPDRAILHLERAGEHALLTYANREAAEHFEKAIAFLAHGTPEDGRMRSVRCTRSAAMARYRLGQIESSYGHFRAALTRLGTPERRGLRLAAGLIFHIPRQVAHRVAPRLLPSRSGRRAARHAERIRLLTDLIPIYYIRGDLAGAVYANFCALNTAERLAPDMRPADATARACANVGAVYGNVLRLGAVAEGYFDRARSIALAADEPAALAYADQVDGMVRVAIGAFQSGPLPLDAAARAYAMLEDWRKWEECCFDMGRAHALRGEFARCIEVAQSHAASARRREDPESEVLALDMLAGALLATGRTDEAIVPLERALELLADRSLPAEEILARGQLALAFERRGDPAAARHQLDLAGALVSRVPNSMIGLEGYASAAEAALALWETEPGRGQPAEISRIAAVATRALTRSARAMAPVYRARASLLTGSLHWLRGDHRRALRAWRASLAAARAIGLPYDEARAAGELGRHLPAGTGERQRLLENSMAIFRRLGASHPNFEELQRT